VGGLNLVVAGGRVDVDAIEDGKVQLKVGRCWNGAVHRWLTLDLEPVAASMIADALEEAAVAPLRRGSE